MKSPVLQAVLRSLAVGAGECDRDLLRRFTASGCESAFAEIVRRHGRLVWTVCRQLTGRDADADDAFQAVFLVLLQNARRVRDGAKLSSWLYGVAFKVCRKVHRRDQRRAKHEKAANGLARPTTVVPDSAWDRALEAVHEEVARLPDSLRIPFVMCCLEGKGVTESAAELGWKLGTFSGRLTRAKDEILARLDARGLSLSVIIGLGLAIPSRTLTARAAALAGAGSVIPSSVAHLSKGVFDMSTKYLTAMAAAVVVTCGLGIGLGTHKVPAAAQPLPADPQAEVNRLQAELDRAKLRVAESKSPVLSGIRYVDNLYKYDRLESKAGPTGRTKKWEFDLVEVTPISTDRFLALLQEREDRGWEFVGLTVVTDKARKECWMFRRAVTRLAPVEENREATRIITLHDPIMEGHEVAGLLYKMAVKRFPKQSMSLEYFPIGRALVVNGTAEVQAWVDEMLPRFRMTPSPRK